MDSQKKALIFIAGLIIGFSASFFWSDARWQNGIDKPNDKTANSDKSLENGNNLETTAGNALVIGKYAIAVSDQPAGKEVRIGFALMAEDGWVAIHEDSNNAPGLILGAQKFPAGQNSGVVELLRATEKNKKYYAMLHSENGDGKFDVKLDAPILSSAGNPFMMMFETTTEDENEQADNMLEEISI